MAAKVLTEAGAEVALLEAGTMWGHRERLEDVRMAIRFAGRGAATPEKPCGGMEQYAHHSERSSRRALAERGEAARVRPVESRFGKLE